MRLTDSSDIFTVTSTLCDGSKEEVAVLEFAPNRCADLTEAQGEPSTWAMRFVGFAVQLSPQFFHRERES